MARKATAKKAAVPAGIKTVWWITSKGRPHLELTDDGSSYYRDPILTSEKMSSSDRKVALVPLNGKWRITPVKPGAGKKGGRKA